MNKITPVTKNDCPDKPDRGLVDPYCYRGMICTDGEVGAIVLRVCKNCQRSNLGKLDAGR